MLRNNKINFHYSIYCDNDLTLSIRYIIYMIQNIKIFINLPCVFKNCILKIHTDDFTHKIINEILSQENIIINDRISFIIHNRADAMRGMFWRLQAIYDECDLSVVCEGDFFITQYLSHLNFIENDNKKSLFGIANRKFNNEKLFLNGHFIFRPSLINDYIKNLIKDNLYLIDNIQRLQYGADENYMSMIILKHMQNENMFIVVSPSKKILVNPIISEEQEIINYQNFFKKSEIIGIKKFNSLLTNKQICINDFIKLKFQSDQSYIYMNKKYNLNVLNRSKYADFKSNIFIQLIRKII